MLKELNPEVLVADGPIVALTYADILAMKTHAKDNPRRRIRVCAHRGVGDAVHEMLIVLARGCYIRPHKHRAKSESFHVVEGELEVVIFDEEGRITKRFSLGDYGSGAGFYYRSDIPEFHTVLVKSEVAVFHETTRGPFNPDDNIMAPWSPEEGDLEAVANFLQKVGQMGASPA